MHADTLFVSDFSSTTMAFNKIVLLLVAALVAPLAMTEAAGAPIVPAWCLCSNNLDWTRGLCYNVGGNWDGGSCGVTTSAKYLGFYSQCTKGGGDFRCWN
ncbi:hypothetical protein EC957_004671 [Mortierella hygrophila]|uniref:Uncharacterized protein n=1 Tax=Mortierella hygrophila TaxID=979708 RepID=A0A9P6F1A0_9FUNG|nr:hypothetical protein EC957_004671 [Mortierella hygrophila]